MFFCSSYAISYKKVVLGCHVKNFLYFCKTIFMLVSLLKPAYITCNSWCYNN